MKMRMKSAGDEMLLFSQSFITRVCGKSGRGGASS